ncbi:unnamed protein product [Rhizoctonia solani]|uniref:Cytochrome c oxidase assembly protein COX11, mitochondrial n=1 Tax=Rhizoctonia solani TaxID=456999 RepID=A0A8H3E591_9AGAM|nr:unnamed protein product [Rhizoctonia solani]
MPVDGSKLPIEDIFGLTAFHCTLQGVFMTMICSALVSRPGDSIWSKVYIVVINLIALLQTIAHVIQCFSSLEEQPPYHLLQELVPRLTAILNASAQLFFIHRCWRIFQRRWLPMIPFAVLFIMAFVPGVGLGTYAYPALSVPEDKLARIKVHFTIWIFCSFSLGLLMTGTTVVYLWRTRTGLKEHSNAFTAIWTIIWISAAPPLILMFICIIEAYAPQLSPRPRLIIALDITGKFSVLSIMISVCGRSLIQEKLNQSAMSRSRSPNGLGTTTIPIMIRKEKTTEYELNEWPIAPGSPRTETNHEQAKSHSEDVITAVGVTYAAVPLYRAFCSATGFGGIPMTDRDSSRYSADRLVPREEAKRIKVHFNADTATALPWQFQPQQRYVNVLPGETSLAFYKAKNLSKDDIIGIATYNVTPAKVAPYFAKVECFCFEEQKLIAGEEVDMPLLFFIDRDIVDDPLMADVDDVVLSYTFFR